VQDYTTDVADLNKVLNDVRSRAETSEMSSDDQRLLSEVDKFLVKVRAA
jgi:hypothetical protein